MLPDVMENFGKEVRSSDPCPHMDAFLTPMSLSSYLLLHYFEALRVPKGGFWDPVRLRWSNLTSG